MHSASNQHRVIHSTSKSVTKNIVSSDARAITLAAMRGAENVLAAATWPLAIVIVATMFRTEIRSALDRLRSIKGPGWEAELDSYIKTHLPATGPSDKIQATAVVSPSIGPVDIIAASWLEVDSALNSTISQKSGIDGSDLTLPRKLAELERISGATRSLISRISELYTIRSRLLHRPDQALSDKSIQLYVENAKSVISEIKG